MKKNIFITGASSGIGKASAILLGNNPDNQLILSARRLEKLEELANHIFNNGGVMPHLLPFDIREYQKCQQAFSSLPEGLKNVDILINNAGLAKGLSEIHEGSIDHWESMIDTNIKGLLYMSRIVSPRMVERKSGHIINICSIAGKEVYPKGNVYNATKFAVDALTKAMRLDLYPYNIKVSSVSPGAVEETEFSLVRYDGDETKANIYKEFTPLRAGDIAEIIEFIISRPMRVDIMDVIVTATQQASAVFTNKSGRIFD